MKKILIAVIIALAAILAYRLDFGHFLENIIIEHRADTAKDCQISENNRTVKLGMSEEEVASLFGAPVESIISEYGFTWNIYHENFKNYIQIGISRGKVVGIYTNSPEFDFYGFSAGSEKEAVHNALGAPLEGIVKGTTRYLSNSSDDGANLEIYKIHGAYVTLFYDSCANNSLASVNIIDYDIEQNFKTLYAQGTDILKKSFEMQNFYVTNATRAKFGLTPFVYSNELAELALLHSRDMVENKYFSHYSLEGDSVLERAQNHNIKFKKIGENLAMGAQNSLYLHELLMNSEGHRANILGDFSHIGTGIAFDSNNTPYLTQNFLK